jgi:SAM-dependent methyltransferase
MPIASLQTGRDERARLLPPALATLFDDRFVAASDRIDAYVARVALRLVRSLGIDRASAQPATPEAIVDACGLVPATSHVPVRWLCTMLAQCGWMTRTGDRFAMRPDVPDLDPAPLATEQAEVDPSALPAYRIVDLAARHYPAVLRGEVVAEDVLFARDHTETWAAYFSNANPLYGVNNALGAMALADALPAGPARVLEIGGGLGSAADAFLARLAAEGALGRLAAYRFTEISVQFLRRAKKQLAADHPAAPLSFAWADIDAAFDAGVLADGPFDAIYGVNVLHVAKDLAATLARLRAALVPGGALVLSECIRPFPDRAIHVELVFNLLGAFRAPVLDPVWRPNGGFLTPEQWTAALRANGFVPMTMLPDVAALRDHYPGFLVGAITARRQDA